MTRVFPNYAAVDRHVGRKLAERRRMLGYSQADVAVALQVTFQQVQKYERGINRMSASRLYFAAVFLNVPTDYFFQNWIDPPPGAGPCRSGAEEPPGAAPAKTRCAGLD